MQKSDLLSVLAHQKKAKELSSLELDKLITTYPFFSSLYLLKSKSALEKEELGSDLTIRKSAAFSINRKHLHHYLFGDSQIASNTLSQINHTQKEVGEISPNPSFERIENSEIEEDNKHLEKANPLDQQILTSAINSSISLEVEDTINLEDLDSLISSKSPIPKKEEDKNQSHSFGDWIKMFGGDIEDQTKSEDHFLEENRLPQKQEFYNAAKMAKLSVQENDDLVTETLANIYADQENYEKAIKAFEKLQLKYPEKRIYFAGRIKEIQIQQNKQ